jgi:FAD/FMN-containing dehydrogenase
MALNSVSEKFLNDIATFGGDDLIADAPLAMLEEPRGKFHGGRAMLAKPRTTQNVMDIVRIAHAHQVPVVPYGGGTGLVGGQVMPSSGNMPTPLIMSMERMTKVRAISGEENVMYVEAGATLADVQAAADSVDRMFPLSLASEGSCRIGGNLATNAGGINTVRYGNVRDLCLGIEAVMADGSLYQGLSCLRKDNRGYDLRNLMIGSEGTLGVITAASLKLFPKAAETATAFAMVTSPTAAVGLLNVINQQLPGLVTAFELIHRTGLEFLKETLPVVRMPFGGTTEWMVLMEITGGPQSNVEERLLRALEAATAESLVVDAIFAQNAAQRSELWSIRESIPEANRKVGSIASTDISVPITAIPAFIDAAMSAMNALGEFRINCFGHIGDGNLHFNVFPPSGKKASDFGNLNARVTEVVYKLVDQFDGSFSAEHGIGRLKVNELKKYSDPIQLAAMRGIKETLDPLGIMNPGVMFGGN